MSADIIAFPRAATQDEAAVNDISQQWESTKELVMETFLRASDEARQGDDNGLSCLRQHVALFYELIEKIYD